MTTLPSVAELEQLANALDGGVTTAPPPARPASEYPRPAGKSGNMEMFWELCPKHNEEYLSTTVHWAPGQTSVTGSCDSCRKEAELELQARQNLELPASQAAIREKTAE